MVQRNSEEFRLNRPAGEAAGAVGFQAGKYERPQQQAPSDSAQTLGALLRLGQAGADLAMQSTAQAAYLDGVRARLAGEAEDTITSDPFSAPFVRGGYQDQDYQVAQAEMQRKLAAEIATTGRTLTPTEFADRVRSEAQGLMGKMGGLTPQSQARALRSQMAMEASLFADHMTAHQKWSIEQAAKARLARGNQLITNLTGAQDPASRQAHVDAAAVFYLDLMGDAALPAEVRTKQGTAYLEALANADQRDVVEQLRANGALDGLGFDDRKAIDTALRSSKQRTAEQEVMHNLFADAALEAEAKAGRLKDPAALKAYTDRGVAEGWMSRSHALTLVQGYVKGSSASDNMIALAGAIQNGDIVTLGQLDHTPASAVEELDKHFAQDTSGKFGLGDRVALSVTAARRVGEVPKSMGALMGSAIRAVQLAGPGGQVSSQYIEVLDTVSQMIHASEENDGGSTGRALLASMPEDTRAAMAHMLEQAKFGVPPSKSLSEYGAKLQSLSSETPLERSLSTQKFRQSLQDLADSQVSSGFLGGVGNALTGNSNLDANPYNAYAVRMGLEADLYAIAQDPRNQALSAEAALNLAQARLGERTIEVGSRGIAFTGEARRPLIMPDTASIEREFGIPAKDKSLIGRKLAELYPSDVDGGLSSAFRWQGGRLEHVLVDSEGLVRQIDKVDTQAVGKAIRDDRVARFEEEQAAHFGAPVRVGDNEITVDGNNTYGLPYRAAYQFRKELAGFEGYRLEVYKDRNGLAVGLGHNVTGTGLKEGDTISREQAEAWFRDDTDRAMGTAQRLAEELGVQSQEATLALAGAAFQLGEAGLRDHQRTAEAIRNRDWETFVKEVRSSKWAEQTPERADWFIRRMGDHFMAPTGQWPKAKQFE